ncbi:P-loop NTPase fold protein [Actinomadura sp. SCN-SB]|uniref:protein kinase domain-containing protein n=1 Tax=Actinomadura sp. SCN-SB TaxID=3373092 RepID=UPI0037514DD2
MTVHELVFGDPAELGRYKVTGRVGSGGQGTVYLGEDPAGHRVAIKVLDEPYPDMENRRRLAREIQACRSVPPYCTARVLDADVTGEQPFVVTEFIDGPSLDHRVRADGPLRGDELVNLAIGTATALIGIHEAGIVHRDFKPSNVLLGADGPRVVDFGLSSYADLERSTMAKGPIGTPVYLAPELLNGEPATPASDVYAWGLTVAFAARGRVSFSGDNVTALFYQIMHTEPDLEGVPGDLRTLLREATQKEPAIRPTARDLRRRLLEMSSSGVAETLAAGYQDNEDLPARYARLGPNAQALFRRAPMLGPDEPLTAETAGLLLDAAPARAVAALTELRLSGLIRVQGNGFGITDPVVHAFAQQRMVTEEPGIQQVVLARLRLAAGKRATVRPDPTVSRDFWTLVDRLGKQPYAASIAAIIRSPTTVPPLTIGIAGPWGAGKTSLMRMVREDLDPADDKGERSKIRLRGGGARLSNRDVLRRARSGGSDPRPTAVPDADDGWRPTIWFNPWMYQSGEQLWAGLAQEIIKQVTSRLGIADRERFWLELNLRRVDTEEVRRRAYRVLQQRVLPLVLIFVLVAAVAAGLLAAGWIWPQVAEVLRRASAAVFSGGAAALAVGAAVRWWLFLRSAAGGTFERLLKQPESTLTEPLSAAPRDPGYAARTGFLHLVQADVPRVLDLVATEQRPLVVFVDDLDRCTPTQVTKVVEALNLFMAGEFPHCVFVVAMEPQVVAAHLASAYADPAGRPPADERLGWRFLEKVVQLPVWLPTTPADRMPGYLRDLLGAQNRSLEETPEDPLAEPIEDGHLVDRLASEIRESRPALPTLQEAARQAQSKVLGSTGETLEPVTMRAFNRVFAELYGADVAYEALRTSLPLLDRPNARAVKRYVNLFRFLTFVAHYEQTARGVLVPSAGKLAKLAALHLRWPQHVRALAEIDSEGATLLARLEKAVRMGVPDAISIEAPFLPEDDAARLQEFLAHGEEIAEEAQRFL